MNINLQNCIKRQNEIDAHRDFWKKPEAEIIYHLENWLVSLIRDADMLSQRTNLNKREMEWLEYARKFIEIAQV